MWFLLGLSALLAVFIWKIWEKETEHLYINEICGWNKTVLSDADEVYMDYIELYNASSETVSLENWYLTNNRELTDKCNLGGMITPIGNPQNLYIFSFYDIF